MVKLCSAADTDPKSALEALGIRREHCVAKLESYRATRQAMLRGRTEVQLLQTARRVGPYLVANAGIALEESQLAWIDATTAALRASRTARPRRARAIAHSRP